MNPGRAASLKALAAAATALTLSTMTGCSGGSGDDALKLVVAQYTDGTQPYWKDFVASFEKENPDIKVDVQVIDWGNLQNQINTMVQTQQLPDILNTNLFADYAESELLYPAEEVMSKERMADFLPEFADNASYKGEQYAMPFVGTVNAMYYNKEVFAEAGIKEPPKTWDDFLDTAEKIQQDDPDTVPYALALGSEGGHGEFGTWARANGGDWKTNGKWTVDSERNVETLEFLRDLTVEHGYTQPNPGKTNRADGTWPLFAQGKAAMVYGSLGTRAFLDPVEEAGVEYGVTTHPVNHGAEPSALGIQDYLMAFNAGGDAKKPQIKKFLDAFYQPDNYAKYLKVEGLLPTTETGSETFREDPDFAEYVEMIPKARFDPTSEGPWAKLKGGLDNELGTAVTKDGDPKAVLERLQESTAEGS